MTTGIELVQTEDNTISLGVPMNMATPNDIVLFKKLQDCCYFLFFL